MKKLFSLFFALVATTALWAYDFQFGDLYYNITSSGEPYTVEVTYQSCWSDDNYWGLTSAVIPETVTYDGTTYSVTSIGGGAFCFCFDLTSVTIGSGVTSIGDDVFYGCSSLTSVVWNAENCADFSYNSAPFYDFRSKITSFTFGDSVKHIPACLCYGMKNLTDVSIGNSVTSIGEKVFKECSGLTSVVWNAENCAGFSYDSAPFYDFRSQITSFTFGDSVKHIPANLCRGMTKLPAITIPNSVTSIGMMAFYDCSGLTSITIPHSVTSIGSYAFSRCSGLTSITIPHSVSSIGESAFSRCSGLTSVIWNAENITNNYEYSFGSFVCSPPFYDSYDSSSQITSFTFGDSVRHIPAHLCYGMTKLPAITIPNSVTSIGGGAFSRCSGLTSVTIGSGVTSIGDEVFYGCSGLTAITIPNSVTSIGWMAFYGCSGLTDVTIGNSVTSIGQYAFQECSKLTSVTIPNSVISIGDEAFRDCSSLPAITIPNSVISIGDEAFQECSKLTSVTIGSGVTSIGSGAFSRTGIYNDESNWKNGVLYISNCLICADEDEVSSAYIIKEGTRLIADYAFGDCSKLTSVTIPNSVTSIGSYAFSRTGIYNDESNWKNGVLYISNCLICADEDEVSSAYIIKEGTRLIADYAFGYCSSLTSVTLPNSVTSIGSSVFYNCSKLTSITIPNSITSIGSSAFFNCSKLTSITIPNSVTSIGSSAFSWCESLKEVICYAEKVPEMGKNVFYNTPQNKATLYVLADALEDYKAAEQWKEFCTILPIQETENDLECIISSSANTHKFVRNGQIIIIRDGKTYNAQGAVIN